MTTVQTIDDIRDRYPALARAMERAGMSHRKIVKHWQGSGEQGMTQIIALRFSKPYEDLLTNSPKSPELKT